jgi:hypothetical protein
MLNKPFRAYLELNTIECEGYCTATSLTSSLAGVLKISALGVPLEQHRRRCITTNLRVTARDFASTRDTFENTPDENEPKFKCVESRYMARKNYSHADQLLNRLQTAAGTETMEYGLDTDPLLSALLQAVTGIGSTETVLYSCKRKSPP